MSRLLAWLSNFRWKPLVAGASRHPAESPVELAAARAQAGADFVASVSALVAFALERDDLVLRGYVSWMRAAFQHWVALSEGPDLEIAAFRGEVDEAAMELAHSFQTLVDHGVRRGDRPLLEHLGRFQSTFTRWADTPAYLIGVKG
jgi:hypothetical protein